jgi:hypothetical protein
MAMACAIVAKFAPCADFLDRDPIAPADRAWWAETSARLAADEAMRACYEELEGRDFEGGPASGLAFPDDLSEGGGS